MKIILLGDFFSLPLKGRGGGVFTFFLAMPEQLPIIFVPITVKKNGY